MNAQAYLLSLREFDLSSTWPQLTAKSDAEFDEWLSDLGLLWKDRLCAHCGNKMSVTRQSSPQGGTQRWKHECNKGSCRHLKAQRRVGYLKGTFFEKMRGDRKKIILLSYLMCKDMGTVDTMAQTCKMDKNTVVQWCQYIRDVFVEYYTKMPTVRMGGPGTVVQIDETCIVRRKYNKGRRVRQDWLVGGIQDGTKLVFAVITAKRDAPTLESIIQNNVNPGGTVVTDCWSGYNNLRNLGYNHQTVNHSQNFVDPVTGNHTQRIENLWCQLKRKIKMRNGLNGDLWDDHFLEVLFNWEKSTEDIFYEFWKEVSLKYPLT